MHPEAQQKLLECYDEQIIDYARQIAQLGLAQQEIIDKRVALFRVSSD